MIVLKLPQAPTVTTLLESQAWSITGNVIEPICACRPMWSTIISLAALVVNEYLKTASTEAFTMVMYTDVPV